ncbi:hypothetical protein VHARVF571_580178 [Vibrio harveyi]|nr:hypothetical protein VHARVF571_580178 [Vibrio harveyi]
MMFKARFQMARLVPSEMTSELVLRAEHPSENRHSEPRGTSVIQNLLSEYIEFIHCFMVFSKR